MRTPLGPVIALLAGLLVLGCSGKPPASDGKDRLEPSHNKVLRIVFDLPGDDIGGPEYQNILDALREAIIRNKAGDILHSGFGMGTMEIVVAVDRDESIGVIRKMIDEAYPQAKYRTEHGTR